MSVRKSNIVFGWRQNTEGCDVSDQPEARPRVRHLLLPSQAGLS